MKLYKINAWFAVLVALVLIVKGVIAMVTDPNINAAIIAYVPMLILFFTGIVLLKAQPKSITIKLLSLFSFISSVTWLAIWATVLIDSLHPIIFILLLLIILLTTFANLALVCWYKWKEVGVVCAFVFTLVFLVFTAMYGASLRSSMSDITVVEK